MQSISSSFLQVMAAAGAFIKKDNMDPDLVPMVIINNVNIKQEINVGNADIKQERMEHGEDVEYSSDMINLNSNANVNCNGVIINWPQTARVCQNKKMREIKLGISPNGNPIKCITRSEVEQRMRRQRGKVTATARNIDATHTRLVVINGKVYKKLNLSKNRNLVHRQAIRKNEGGEYTKENTLPIITSVRGNVDIMNMQSVCSYLTQGTVRKIPIAPPGIVRNGPVLHQGTERNAHILHQGSMRNAPMLHKGTMRNANVLHQGTLRKVPILHQDTIRNSPILHPGIMRHVPHLPSNSKAFCHKCPTCNTNFASAQRYF